MENNIPKGPSQTDILDCPIEVCPECGCKYWDTVNVVKRVSGLLMGAPSKYVYIPVTVKICHNCNTLAPYIANDPEYANLLKTSDEETKQTPKFIV